jgi:hypothetical protein
MMKRTTMDDYVAISQHDFSRIMRAFGPNDRPCDGLRFPGENRTFCFLQLGRPPRYFVHKEGKQWLASLRQPSSS